MRPYQLIILDRDGVINLESDEYIKSLEEWHPIPGSLEAITLLKKAGFLVTIASNQSGVARGLLSLEKLQVIHNHLQATLKIHSVQLDGIYFCPHHPDEGCDCRKPKPGLLTQTLNDFKMAPTQTVVIGDSWRDIEAGLSIGIQTILVKTGRGEKTREAHLHELSNTLIFDDLLHAAHHLIGM